MDFGIDFDPGFGFVEDLQFEDFDPVPDLEPEPAPEPQPAQVTSRSF